MARKPALGKGLDALLGEVDAVIGQADTGSGLKEVPTDALQPNPFQPRTQFDEEAIAALAATVQEQGIMQPVLVRPIANGALQIISGERRWRAAKHAGLAVIPIIEREATDQEAVVLALVENLQREELSAYDAAVAMRRLHDDFGMPQGQIATLVGKARSTVSNTIRLLELHKSVQALLRDRKIEEAAARTLINVPASAQRKLANRIVERSYSVRQTEALVKRYLNKKKTKTPDPDVVRLEEDLAEQLGARVFISRRGKRGSGTLRIQYRNLEQLQSIVERILPQNENEQ